jgi:hypothetical protein
MMKNDKKVCFPVRGFHLDLRIQVMTLDALKSFAGELVAAGMNTLIMEYEATFPFERHVALKNEYSYTKAEITEFVSFCRELGLDVIPLQQCFGHSEYILRHPRYAYLRENRSEISQICPLKERDAKELFREIFAELIELHPSEYFHIGGDETWLLGTCDNCSEKAAKEGKSKLYVDYMKMICELVISFGKRPVLWADIVLNHPEAVQELPGKTVFIDWNYGSDGLRPNIDKLLEMGCEFWGAPALRCHPDNWHTVNWDRHFKNLEFFIPHCREKDYQGVIMTSWSTSGLYDYEWGAHVGEVVEMYPFRRVYPLSGFRILLMAFAESLRKTEPLVRREFIVEYAMERFGFDEKIAGEFCEILLKPQPLIKDSYFPGEEAGTELEVSLESLEKLKNFSPERNCLEYQHFVLMLEIRCYWLKFKKIQQLVNSRDFDIRQMNSVTGDLRKLLEDADRLDKEFKQLQTGFLYDSELDVENLVRRKPVKILYDRLTGRRG